MVASEKSEIKNKAALRKFLYNNPRKLALKLASYITDDDGNALPLVKLKGTGQGYYFSMNDKKLVRVSRSGEYYLLPWEDTRDKDKCFIYTHYVWMTGCILNVYKKDIEILGGN